MINPNECLNSKKYYYECFGVVGLNSDIIKFPFINDKRIKYIDMNKYICRNNNHCNFVINNCPVYKDDNHLTIQFATKLKKEFLQQFHIDRIENNIKYKKEWYRCITLNGNDQFINYK